MTVEIRILADTASEAREEMARLFGSVRLTSEGQGLSSAELADLKPGPIMKPTVEERLVARVGSDKAAELALSDKSLDELAAIADGRAPAEAPAFREFGKAPEGKTRRTKEEIAEDERVQELAEKTGATEDWIASNVQTKGHAEVIGLLEKEAARQASEAGQANISAAPEDRQDPENPEDAAQDAADEQAEVDAGRDADKPLTKDDLKDVMVEFQGKHGMPETQKRGPAIFEKALGKPPAGEAAWRLSLISDDDQKQLSAAIAAWKEAV